MRNGKYNAKEFGSYAEGEGWMYGLLAACSVEEGVNVAHGNLPSIPGKISPKAFADEAGADRRTVMRALQAWDRLAAEGVVKQSSSLRPIDVPKVTLPDNEQYPWASYVDKPERDYEAERLRALANKVPPAKIVAALSPTQRTALAREVVKTAPEAVTKAQYEDRQERRERIERDVNDLDLRTIQDGGKPDTGPGPQPESVLDMVFRRHVLLDRAERLCQQAQDLIGQAREVPIPWEDADDTQVHEMALLILGSDEKEGNQQWRA